MCDHCTNNHICNNNGMMMKTVHYIIIQGKFDPNDPPTKKLHNHVYYHLTPRHPQYRELKEI